MCTHSGGPDIGWDSRLAPLTRVALSGSDLGVQGLYYGMSLRVLEDADRALAQDRSRYGELIYSRFERYCRCGYVVVYSPTASAGACDALRAEALTLDPAGRVRVLASAIIDVYELPAFDHDTVVSPISRLLFPLDHFSSRLQSCHSDGLPTRFIFAPTGSGKSAAVEKIPELGGYVIVDMDTIPGVQDVYRSAGARFWERKGATAKAGVAILKVVLDFIDRYGRTIVVGGFDLSKCKYEDLLRLNHVYAWEPKRRQYLDQRAEQGTRHPTQFRPYCHPFRVPVQFSVFDAIVSSASSNALLRDVHDKREK